MHARKWQDLRTRVATDGEGAQGPALAPPTAAARPQEELPAAPLEIDKVRLATRVIRTQVLPVLDEPRGAYLSVHRRGVPLGWAVAIAAVAALAAVALFMLM